MDDRPGPQTSVVYYTALLWRISFFFFFNDPPPPEISTLPLPAPLPISWVQDRVHQARTADIPEADAGRQRWPAEVDVDEEHSGVGRLGQRPREIDGCRRLAECSRSEEHTSELQSRLHLVCRLLLEKKKK